jgi:hypothetical protein
MHHSSFGAFIRNYGTHETRAVGFRCWNTELIQCLNAVTHHGWTELDRTIAEVKIHLDSLFSQAFDSMREELARIQAPALLVQNFVHREKQVSEVLAKNLDNLYRNYSILKQLATSGDMGSFVLDYMNPVYDRCSRDSGEF